MPTGSTGGPYLHYLPTTRWNSGPCSMEMKCPLARNVWAMVRGKLRKCNSESPNFYTLARQLEEKLPKKDLEVWAMVSWSIWNARNRFHFEEKQSMPSDILHGATTLLQKYQRLCKTSTSTWVCAKALKGYSFITFSPLVLRVFYSDMLCYCLCSTLVHTRAGYTKPRWQQVCPSCFQHNCKLFSCNIYFYLSLKKINNNNNNNNNRGIYFIF